MSSSPPHPATLLATALTTLLLATCTAAPAAPTAPAPAIQTLDLEPATASAQTVTAVVVPRRSAELSSLFGAPVRDLPLEEGALVSAGDAVVLLEAPELELAVTAADAALTSAQVNAQLQRYSDKVLNDRGKWVYRTGPPELRQAADARAVEAGAALAVAQGELVQAVIRAPFDSTIAEISIREGEMVSPGVRLATIADLTEFRLETTDLSEREVIRVAVGQRLFAYVEALDQHLAVIVASISPLGEAVGGDVLYRVVLDFESQPEGLLWGMTAELSLAAR